MVRQPQSPDGRPLKKAWRSSWRSYGLALALLFSFLGGLGSLACRKDRDRDNAAKDIALEHVRLQLPWTMQAQFAGPVVASRPGGEYYKHGLEVEIREGGFNIDTPVQIASGAATFGILQPDQLIYFNSKNKNPQKHLRAIAVIFKESMTAFMVRADSGISDVSHFRGKRIGTKEGTNVDNELNALLAKKGLDRRKDIHTVPVQWDLAPFLSGAVDVFPGFIINEPFQARKAGMKIEILTPSQFGLNLYGDVLVTSQEVIDQQADLVRAFVAATLEGWNAAYENPAETISLILAKNPLLEADHQRYMLTSCRNLLSGPGAPVGLSKLEVWREMLLILETYGGLQPRVLKADNLFTNQFLPKVNRLEGDQR